jgi:hypothetical protein
VMPGLAPGILFCVITARSIRLSASTIPNGNAMQNFRLLPVKSLR